MPVDLAGQRDDQARPAPSPQGLGANTRRRGSRPAVFYAAASGLLHRREGDEISGVLPRSDGVSEFGEDRCEPMPRVDIPAELVVAATEILHERVPGTDHARRAEPFQTRASAAAGPSDVHDRLRRDYLRTAQ
jgi:hypothetical protein